MAILRGASCQLVKVLWAGAAVTPFRRFSVVFPHRMSPQLKPEDIPGAGNSPIFSQTKLTRNIFKGF
jgi:hypothetical protein